MALARGHASVTRGARSPRSSAPRAPAASPRAWLGCQWRRHGARARARSKARTPSRRIAGRPGAAPTVASADPRGQVGPRTSRPSRGMQAVRLRDGCHRIPRAGFRDCALRSLSVGRSLRPIIPGGLSAVARFGPRARARTSRGAPAKCAGAQLVLEGARSGRKPLRPPAPGDPGLQLRRGTAGWPAPRRGRHAARRGGRGRRRAARRPHAAVASRRIKAGTKHLA